MALIERHFCMSEQAQVNELGFCNKYCLAKHAVQ